MPLPLPALTFTRMADKSPAAATLTGLLDAIHAALTATVDYRGTATPTTHRWNVTKAVVGAVTEAVVASAPTGTSMTKVPAIIYAGRALNAGTMASPDLSVASALQVGLNKNGGVYADWAAVLPMTSGQFFGYWNGAPVSVNAVATVVRCFVSTETIFVQIIQSALVQWWMYSGAIVEPYDADTVLSGETDNRLYGQFVAGGGVEVAAAWLNTATAMWGHDAAGVNPHGGVFVPGAGTLYVGGRKNICANVGSTAQTLTPSGVYAGDIMEFGRSTASNTNNGVRMGTVRGVYCAGLVQSGRFLRNGATDLYHFASPDTLNPAGAIMLPAVA